MAKTGRRPGDSGSKQAIHDAARHQFAAHGYRATTIRSIAAEAEVDPALVMHFFASKDALFAACVQWPFDPAGQLAEVLAGGRENIGRRIVELFVRTWDEAEGRNPIVELLRAAMTEQPAENLLREFLTNQIFAPIVRELRVADAELRANLVAGQLLGLGVTRYVMRMEPLASTPSQHVIDCLALSVQATLTGPLPKAARRRTRR